MMLARPELDVEFHTKYISPLTLIVGCVLLRKVWRLDITILTVSDVSSAVSKGVLGLQEVVPRI